MKRMERASEYFLSLSAGSRERYECKVTSCGLNDDPYAISEGWTESPELIPELQWSDIMLYMVCTPIPHTKESIKGEVKH